jgi:retron-type reverse transcriptase
MDTLEKVPGFVLWPLPANATVNAKLEEEIDALVPKLPGSLPQLSQKLNNVRSFAEYDSAANRACAEVWQKVDLVLASGNVALKGSLLAFASLHMTPQAQARICRRLVKDSDPGLRRKARTLVEQGNIREVALPRTRDGDWDTSGWLHGSAPGPISRHPQGRRIQERHGLPVLTNVGQLRKLLGIQSPQQLGWFFLASHDENGPYTTFNIPKRCGGERLICAPKKQLRWVQRQVLEKVLDKVAPHPAAHGFVIGRSTVTNAAAHRGAELVLKFDLSDFFPTIHYYRVVGLFTRLGYPVGNSRFHTNDAAREVAPALARLCCYTPDPYAWGRGRLPQGAPTSPAISNLVCRRLDARLTGLATRNGGTYTRYADDLTFSFKEDNVELGRFRWWVDQICHQEGFLINQHKFRVIRRAQRQLVTGIVVNDELRIPREERRRFRAILHNCRTQGIVSQAKGRPRFADYLRGFASYVHMVHPEEGHDLLRQVEELLGPEDDKGGAA